MGREFKDFTLEWSISKHNSDRDAEDEALEVDMIERINEVIADSKYDSLQVRVAYWI